MKYWGTQYFPLMLVFQANRMKLSLMAFYFLSNPIFTAFPELPYKVFFCGQYRKWLGNGIVSLALQTKVWEGVMANSYQTIFHQTDDIPWWSISFSSIPTSLDCKSCLPTLANSWFCTGSLWNPLEQWFSMVYPLSLTSTGCVSPRTKICSMFTSGSFLNMLGLAWCWKWRWFHQFAEAPWADTRPWETIAPLMVGLPIH